MAVRYSVTNHPLLSERASRLAAPELEAHNRVAEILIGLWKFAAFTEVGDPDKFAQATDAVAMQVNYQVESGIEAFILSNLVRGKREFVYRNGRHRMNPVHSMAKKIVNAIKPQA